MKLRLGVSPQKIRAYLDYRRPEVGPNATPAEAAARRAQAIALQNVADIGRRTINRDAFQKDGAETEPGLRISKDAAIARHRV